MDKVEFTTENGEKVLFYILEQTTISGRSYLLVTDQEEGDGEAWILRGMPGEDAGADGEVSFEMVEDEEELKAVGAVFAQLLEDIDLA